MKAISTLAIFAFMVVAVIGLSGEGALWTRYVGASAILVLLMLILVQVSNIPTTSDLRKIFASMASPAERQAMTGDDEDDVNPRRSARN